MTPRWTGDGSRYGLTWWGQSWSLDVESETPGLTTIDGKVGPLLAIDGLIATGRRARGIFGRSCLISHEVRFDRVEAVYEPEAWNSLQVRASWWPRDEGTVDLEVQIQAFTVDELREVEVIVASVPILGRPFFLQIAHPDDLSRRPVDVELQTESRDGIVRCRLFGHDLEKGVVLRGRVRGTFLDQRPTPDMLNRLVGAFVDQPLPLGT